MAQENTSGGGDDHTQEKEVPSKPWHQMSREEVMGRLNDFEAKKRANRRRVSGDDVQEMLRERRAQRQQRRRERRQGHGKTGPSRREVGQLARLSLGGALLVGTISTGALAASITETNREASQGKEQEIALLEGEVRALESDSWGQEEVVQLQEQQSEATEQAWRRGEEVAELQNTYQEILADLNNVEGEDSDRFDPVDQHRQELVDYFAESARVIEDEDSYYPGADVPYGSEKIDVLAPWYTRYVDQDRRDYAQKNAWELAAATPRVGSAASVSVVWLNRDDSSGDLLSWARGTYDAGSEAFHSLHVGQTTRGEQHGGGEGQD